MPAVFAPCQCKPTQIKVEAVSGGYENAFAESRKGTQFGDHESSRESRARRNTARREEAREGDGRVLFVLCLSSRKITQRRPQDRPGGK